MESLVDRVLNKQSRVYTAKDKVESLSLDKAIARQSSRLSARSQAETAALQAQVHQDQLQDQLGFRDDLGIDSDITRTIAGSVRKGVASGFIEGPGRAGEAIFGEDGFWSAMAEVGEIAGEQAQAPLDARDLNTLRAIEESTPQGDVGDISTWNFGSNPSLKGYAYQFLGILGEFAPQAAGLAAKSPKAAAALMAAIGGGQAGSAQANDAEDYIRGLGKEEFLQKSDMGRELVDAGSTVEEAQEEVAKVAGRTAFGVGAAIGGVGGAATSYIIRGLPKAIAGGTVGRTVTSAVEEGAQEVGETVLSRAAVNARVGTDQDIDRDTFADLVLGGGFGGGLGGAGATVEAAANVAEKAKAAATEKKVKTLRDTAEAADIAEKGDFDTYLDPKKETYNPLKAVKAIGIAVRKEKDPEKRAELETKAEQAIEVLQEKSDDIQFDIDELQPNYTKELAATVERSKEKLADMDQESEAAKSLIDNIAINERVIAELDAMDPKAKKQQLKALEKKQAPINDQLSQAKTITDSFKISEETTESVETPEQPAEVSQSEVEQLRANTGLDSTVEKSVKEPDQVATDANKLVVLAMSNPDIISASEAANLAEQNKAVLSEANLNYLRKFSEAETKLLDLKNHNRVSKDVISGGQGFIGLEQRKEQVAAAVKRGDTEAVEGHVQGLREFYGSHRAKAEKAAEAVQKASETGEAQYLVRGTGNKDWKILPESLVSQEIKDSRPLIFKPNDGGGIGLSNIIAREAEAIKSSGQQAAAALNVLSQSEETVPVTEPTSDPSVLDEYEQQAGVQNDPIEPVSGESGGSTQSESPEPSGVRADAESTPEPRRSGSGQGRRDVASTESPSGNDGEAAPVPPEASQQAGSLVQAQDKDSASSDEVVKTSEVNEIYDALMANKAVGLLIPYRSKGSTEAEYSEIEVRVAKQAIKGEEQYVIEFTTPDGVYSLGVNDLSKNNFSKAVDDAIWKLGRTIEKEIIDVSSYDYNEENELYNEFEVLLEGLGKQSNGERVFDEEGDNESLMSLDTDELGELLYEEVTFTFSLGNKKKTVFVTPNLADRNYKIRYVGESSETVIGVPSVDVLQETIEKHLRNSQKVGYLTIVPIDLKEDTNPVNTQENSALGEDTEGAPSEDITVAGLPDPEAELPKEEGALSTFKRRPRKLPEQISDAVFRSLNLVNQYFTQRGDRKPLVRYKDFMTALEENPRLAEKFLASTELGDKDKLSDKQLKAVQHMISHVTEWNAYIKDNLIKKELDRDVTFKNLFHQLRDYDVPEENLLSAISVAAYQHVSDGASSDLYKDEEQINRLLSRARTHEVTTHEKTLFSTIGIHQRTVATSIGKDIIDALGIVPRGDVFKNLKPDLEASLGAYALQLLVDKGFVEDIRIPRIVVDAASEGISPQVAEERRLEELKNKKGDQEALRETVNFVRIKRNKPYSWDKYEKGANNTPYSIKEFAYKNSNTKGVVSNLFSINSKVVEPNFDPKEWNQTESSKGVKVTSIQDETEQKRNSFIWQVRPDGIFESFMELDEDLQNTIIGMVPEDALIHVDNKRGVEAKNNSLGRQLGQIKDLFLNTENRNKTFTFPGEIYKQQRVGILANVANPQTSKTARSLISQTDWVTEVPVHAGRKTHKNFIVAIGLGLGLGVDNLTVKTAVKETTNELNKEVYQKAIEAIKVQLKDGAAKLESHHKEAIAAAVKEGGEALHTYDALVQYTRMLEAKRTKQKSFSTSFFMEVDGKANGPTFTQALLGAHQDGSTLGDVLTLGGFFNKETSDQFKGYGEYAEKGGFNDLYQNIAEGIALRIRELIEKTPDMQGGFESIWFFNQGVNLFNEDGGIDVARKVVKTPFTALNFGSKMGTSFNNMAEDFVGNIKATIEKAARNNDEDARKQIIEHLNNILGREAFLPETDFNFLLDQGFENTGAAEEFRSFFRSAMYGPVTDQLSEQFEVLLHRRDSLNGGTNIAFNIFNAVYEYKRNQLIKESQAKLKLPTKDLQNSTAKEADLTQEQESQLLEELGELFPRMHTAFSSAAADPDARLHGVKRKNREVSRRENQEYTQEVAFPPAEGDIAERRGANSILAKGQLQHFAEPGVSMLPFGTHSFDSAVSSYATLILEKASLNVHDAHIGGVAYMEAMGKALNEATFKAMSEYSLSLSMFEMVQNTLTAFSELPTEIQQAPEVQQSLVNSLRELGVRLDPEVKDFKQIIRATYLNAREAAYQAELAKLKALGQTKTISQYVISGGEYTVKPTDVRELRDKYAQVRQEFADIKANDPNLEVLEGILNRPLRKAAAETKIEYVDAVDVDTLIDSASRFIAEGQQNPQGTNGNLSPDQIGFLEHIKAYRDELVLTGKRTQALEKIPEQSRAAFKKRLNRVIANHSTPRTSISEINSWALRDLIDDIKEIYPDEAKARGADEEFVDNLLGDLDKILEAIPEKQADKSTVYPGFDTLMADVETTLEPVAITQFLSRFYNADRFTSWGLTGQSQVNHDNRILNLFSERRRLPLKEFMLSLAAHANEDINLRNSRVNNEKVHKAEARYLSGQREIMRALLGKLPDGATVQLVDKDTPPRYGRNQWRVRGANAWYDRKTNTVFVKNPDFVDSAVTRETMLHETLHAVLSDAIGLAENGKGTKEGLKLYADLEKIRQQAADYINGLDTLSGADKSNFSAAVSNVHELISYGLTDRKFQDTVLSKIFLTEAESKQVRGLKTKLQEFVRTIANFLFGKEVSKHATGFEAVFYNSMAMLEQVESSRKKTNQRFLKSRMDQLYMQESGGTNARESAATMTNAQVFSLLADPNAPLDAEHAADLQSLLSDVAQQFHGPWGSLAAQFRKTSAYTPDEMMAKWAENGQLPFISKAKKVGAYITDQESFVLEQVEQIIEASLDSDLRVRAELAKLYQEAKNKLTPADLPPGVYDFIFSPAKDLNGKTEHLQRFAALGLVYQPLKAKLGFDTDISRQDSIRSISDLLRRLFTMMMRLLRARLTGVADGQKADDKLNTLVRRLVQSEAKSRSIAANKARQTENRFEDAFERVASNVRSKTSRLANSAYLRGSAYTIPKSIGLGAEILANDRVREVSDQLDNIRNRVLPNTKQGFINSIMNEIKGNSPMELLGHSLHRMSKTIDQIRKNKKTWTVDQLRESFDPNYELSEEVKTALTHVLLKTDISALLGDPDNGLLDINQLVDLIKDPVKLRKAIKAATVDIEGSTKHADHMINYAKDAAFHMVHGGNSSSANQLLNAHNIVHGLGSPLEGQISDRAASKLEPKVDKLISLMALDYTSPNYKSQISDVLANEANRGNASGVLTTLKMHNLMKAEAFNTLFDGQKTQIRKGYIKEIFDPNRVIEVAPESKRDEMLAKGWDEKGILVQDPNDIQGREPMYIFTRAVGLGSRASGSAALTGMETAGTRYHKGLAGQDGETQAVRLNMNRRIASRRRQEIAAISSTPHTSYDPRTNKKRDHMVPVFTPDGRVANYRHMMTEQAKDQLIGRNMQFDEVMGTMVSNAYDKTASQVNNKILFDALLQQYKEESIIKPEAYVLVGPGSSDKQLRETWKMLPESTKIHIEKTWGTRSFYVRNDLLDMHFGYRKLSIASPYLRDASENKHWQNMTVLLTERIFGKKFGVRLSQGENIWHELAKVVRDIWVIKNFFTFLGNLQSNMTLLFAHGVSWRHQRQYAVEGLEGILSYQKATKEKNNLENMLEAGFGTTSPDVLRNRIAELDDEIARNPVKELVDAGLAQTIIEDIETDEDHFGFKSDLKRKTDKYTSWVPDPIKDGAKTVYLAHDTPLYKFMFQGTAQSDFVARYTLFKHLTLHAKNPLSKEEALQKADNAFVNYDIASNKYLQYANDSGLIPFTKYYLRIQKIIYGLWRSNPARMLAISALDQSVESISTINDSLIWNKFDNLTSTGALELPTSFDEIFTINAMLSGLDM